MRKYCDVCGAERETHVEDRWESYHVKDDPVTIKILTQVRVCECGNDLYDMYLDDMTFERVYRIYRERHGILSPDEIKVIRERAGLTQRELAELLNCDESTVRWYEIGALPDQAHNDLLRMIDRR